MTRYGLLRVLALAMLVGAVTDPGCLATRSPAVVLVAGAEVAPRTLERVRRTLADAGLAPSSVADGPDTVRVGVGSPRGLIDVHRERPLTIAVQTPEVGLHVSDVVPPRLSIAGTSSSLRVRVVEDGAATGAEVTVRVRDVTSGQRVGLAHGQLNERHMAWLDVPMLPTTAGRWALCVAAVRMDAREAGRCERLDVEVLPPRLRVEVLEARPSWSARFARLALERWDGAQITSTVRVAAPVTVTAGPADRRPGEPDDADVVLVGGLDALTSADVARLARAARDEGRTVMLLADGPLDASRTGDLWPYALSSTATAPTPLSIAVGPHTWRAREWLAPVPRATDVEALAYLDASAPVPVVMARALGTGRVVVVSAVDTWRWRRAGDVSFDAAWQALVVSLAADAAMARRPTVWRLAGPLTDEVHVAWQRGDARAGTARDVPPPVRLAHDTTREAIWFPGSSSSGPLRARLDLARSVTPAQVMLGDEAIGNRSPVVIDVGAQTLPATWLDVQRRLEADGARVVDERALPAALQYVGAPTIADGSRWFVTRQWWFAAGVLGVLGLEWWWRRLARHR